jgi:hypothetical protein
MSKKKKKKKRKKRKETFKSLSNAIEATLEGFATLHNVLDVKKAREIV